MESKYYYFLNRSNYIDETIVCYFAIYGPRSTALTISIYSLYIFISSLSFLTICGNLLVITSIIYFRQLHTPTNFLLLSLAVADLLVGMELIAYEVLPYSFITCMWLNIVDVYLCTCSVWNLCFISVDRYYAVCQPLRYRTKMNPRVTLIMILMSWTISAITVQYFGLQDFGILIPAVVMSAIYLKILIVAQRQARSIQNTTCQRTKSESKMERKAIKTLGIVMGLFLICWAPFLFTWAIAFNPYIPMSLLDGAVILAWSNSVFNPFIYAFFYSWFRSAFRMIICGKIFQGDFTHSKLS